MTIIEDLRAQLAEKDRRITELEVTLSATDNRAYQWQMRYKQIHDKLAHIIRKYGENMELGDYQDVE